MKKFNAGDVVWIKARVILGDAYTSDLAIDGQNLTVANRLILSKEPQTRVKP